MNSCFFCSARIDKKEVFFLKNIVCFVCANCFSIVNVHSSFLKSAKQALYHENLFIGNDFNRQFWVDAQNLRNLIRHDYPIYFGEKNQDLILEIGAGRGSLLKALRDEGYNAIGCEYSAKLVETGRAIYGLPEESFFQLDAWDLPDYLKARGLRPTVLVFWHVIEHIYNSLDLIEKLVDSSSKSLTLIFQTPLPVPSYIVPEHLFFPTTETYHFISERIEIPLVLLNIVPYTRFVTCVLSNKNIQQGEVYPKESNAKNFSLCGQLIAQLDAGLRELDEVTKKQYEQIVDLKKIFAAPTEKKPLELTEKLFYIHDLLRSKLLDVSKIKNLEKENKKLRLEMLRAEAQLSLLKEILLHNSAGFNEEGL